MSTNDKIVELTAMGTPGGKATIGDVVVFNHKLYHGICCGTVLAIAAPNNLVLKQVFCVRYNQDNVQQVYRQPNCTIKNYMVTSVIH